MNKLLVLVLSISLMLCCFSCTNSNPDSNSGTKQNEVKASAQTAPKTDTKPIKTETKTNVTFVGNSVCPVSGKPVAGNPQAPNFYSDHNNFRIGFMCPVCKGKFDSADDAKKDEFLAKALDKNIEPKH